MATERTYVVLVSAAGLAALAGWVLARRASGASADTPLVASGDGVLEDITVTAQRLPSPVEPQADNRPRGIKNNNPGNLRFLRTNYYNGQIADDGSGYGVYSSASLGLRALALELRNDYERKSLNTIDKLITEWAPPNENPTVAYINAVSRALNVPANRTIALNRQTWFKLVRAIIRQENGADFYSDEQIGAALVAAGIPP